ncbi:FecR family protein [Mucilaginibacter rubeus]|uniref:FecR family protein n=1 Tax=Mucilaginibacter rubeus TaxID=2027860 RepID=A0AAE6MJD2_9SPHI|nr:MULTISPECIES: FecR family protein [Mucilaginibacter]QEM05538.1 FecR family protein [Mucilaginibacter rubeus]QEM18123.1 FecR family protein [Mucilaginibacter gossypii]QTE45341.1 FecR family protein [Mucilaginibacter rubeus]QTE51938.1 FecR family protein [Mucilaginibacter rubeus]QTE57026.1 FecR family protein [Mucilaginibacter rubeus]
MSRHQIAALLDRYLKGETTNEENELVERWLEENNNINAQWDNLDHLAKDKWLSSLFSEIKNTIHQTEAKVMPLPQRKPGLWRSIAAVAAAVLLISFTLYLEWPSLQSRLHPVELTVIRVPINQKSEITLTDGSRVWLNAGSELKYPKAFNGKTREVYLSGEAFFDVRHDTGKPFIIHTGTVLTTVLGTAFNIKEDKYKHTIQVTVARGKVSVANGNKLLGVIIPNQQISFNTLKAEVVQATVNANAVAAWQQSDLHFEDVSFGDAVVQLQQHFNVEISFRNIKLKDCHFTGTSLRGEELDKILKVMCAFNNAIYEIKPDGSIVIDGPGCNTKN